MLEFTKKVLQKVSFDPRLFEKELRKGIRNLQSTREIQHLRQWCLERFSKQYSLIIDNCFNASYA